MLEIISEEQNKVKRMKRTEDSLRDLWDNIKHIWIIGVPEKRRWKKGKKSPVEDKPKEKHTNTHTNQTNKDGHKERILKAATEKQQVTHKRKPYV